MGRFTVGQCRTGKTITSHPDRDALETYDEIFDAMAVLSYLAAREYRLKRDTEAADHLAEVSEKLVHYLVDSGQWGVQMDAIGAKTSIDIRHHAYRLLRPEFKE